MVQKSTHANECPGQGMHSFQGRKPPSERPSSALFRIISPDGSSRELQLRCGEEAQVLNRIARLESVLPAEESPAFCSPPIAVLAIAHRDGSGRNTYTVEEDQTFHFGMYTFKLATVS